MKKYISTLTIAGSDSSGGAGIQADLKTFAALGCFGTSAITAITVQNTLGVTGIHPVPAAVVEGQIRAVLSDIKPSAIKIGMVHSADTVRAIVGVLKDYPGIPVILDPVMVSSSGRMLMEEETITVLQELLFPLVTLVTPNLDEAGILSGISLHTVDDMKAAAARILETGCNAVLVKGGHLSGSKLYDVYLDKSGLEHIITSNAIATNNTHGTGCTLSSAITAFLARGMELVAAIEQGSVYMHTAIEQGMDVKTGEGHGPVNHFFDPVKQIII
ncbi:hydroxymethylpyrimidine/phosphomethylpyrimidine kinase [Chitinophaga sp. YR573]|uniref:bifunctional hydroxymethylpyrimidine kinase/phosphomethylpyrimidine kinase n=1 Tax=Chitinophaga sp. YR573 TaxID=1881040 RepID=UPI0008D786E0|nr:bifunctional hydroxymethylpyrimidine kinase/phosphomethylpyrimidine kinase [Chitinophaga sp. YR573]SEV89182.1 hydroxymethylpyrimidine/phosphomethylpyrimidine kinase [Chitinophaga sp. YR573]